uniref:Exocyst subunit Exo70 family protein n=1 Tax=Arundo donax TaxID=35708 RepID=A0A0A9F6W9_ARUDO
MSPLTSMIMEMVSCLEQTLAKRSQSFPDHSLRFLFLINNSYFIWRQLSPTSVLEFHMTVLTHKIDNYTETYLQLSWAPVLSCLYSSTHLLLGRYSSLAKFESEFQKTYNTQKLWKVPDPELRTRLRQAIIERVISGFAKYLEYSNITSTGVNPQELEEMLQELFEG